MLKDWEEPGRTKKVQESIKKCGRRTSKAKIQMNAKG